jgi:hypothetical protein
VIFIASRLTFWAMGVRFASDEVSIFWQYLDIDLLRHDLWRSVLYLHGQPPLMNIFYGLSLKLFPKAWPAFAYSVNLVMGLAAYLAIYTVAVRNHVSRYFALAVVIIAMCNPSAAVFEAEPYYTHTCFCLLIFAAFFFDSYLRSPRIWTAACFLGMLATLVLWRASYQPLWFAAMALWLVRMTPSKYFKPVLAIALSFGALIGLLLLKNAILLGSFNTSSWSGISLSEAWAWRRPFPVIAAMIQDGRLSRVSTIRPNSDPEQYAAVLGSMPKTGIEALDAPHKHNGYLNLNNSIYIRASRAYWKDYWTVWRFAPEIILRMWPENWAAYFRSTSRFATQFDPNNQSKIESVDFWYQTIFCCGQTALDPSPQTDPYESPGERIARLFGAACWPTIATEGVLLLILVFPSLRRSIAQNDKCQQRLLLFLAVNVIFSSLLVNVVESGGENMRYRYETHGLVLIAIAILGYRFFTAEEASDSGSEREGQKEGITADSLRE